MIGVFDSGVGGLSVWREIVKLLPDCPTLYIADQQHAPYGQRTDDEILEYARVITSYLIAQGCNVIVVACNTASAVSLELLRTEFCDIHIIGMEPAIKPAVSLSRNGVIGVWATPGTFRGPLFNETVRRHAPQARVIRQPCPGLVELIETGHRQSLATRSLIKTYWELLQTEGVDTIVLGCTHYPFVRDLIQEIAGPQVEIVDPAPAVASRTAQLLGESTLKKHPGANDVDAIEPRQVRDSQQFFTSGNVDQFQVVASGLLRRIVPAHALNWRQGQLLPIS